MKITVTATLNEEQIDILAKQKGYQDKVQTPVEKEESYEAYTWIDGVEVPAGTRIVQVMEEVTNPQSKEDFIRQVYEGIILNDATREYITYSTRQKEEARIAEENAIREQVAQSITSTIE